MSLQQERKLNTNPNHRTVGQNLIAMERSMSSSRLFKIVDDDKVLDLIFTS